MIWRKAFCIVFILSCCSVSLSFAQSSAKPGTVTISYTLSRLAKMASNQFAIWIEDEEGHFVRTLFVTNFVGKRAGWKTRPQCVPTWVQAAKIMNLPQKEVDAVSGATPQNGTYEILWDLRDSNGKVVPHGTFRYRMEGNIFQENRVSWTGTITIGSEAQSSHAEVAYSPGEAVEMGTLISSVSATFLQGE